MIQAMYCIKDTKSEFWKPFCHFNDQTAIREVAQMVNTSGNPVYDNPADYELWKCGNYDTATGMIIPTIEFVVGCGSLKKVNAE